MASFLSGFEVDHRRIIEVLNIAQEKRNSQFRIVLREVLWKEGQKKRFSGQIEQGKRTYVIALL